MNLSEKHDKAIEIIMSISTHDDAPEEEVFDALSKLNELIAHERRQLKTRREKIAKAANKKDNDV